MEPGGPAGRRELTLSRLGTGAQCPAPGNQTLSMVSYNSLFSPPNFPSCLELVMSLVHIWVPVLVQAEVLLHVQVQIPFQVQVQS